MPPVDAAPTVRRPVRAALAGTLALVLGFGAVACSGSEGGSGPTTLGTALATPATGDPALGDLADLDGSLDGLSGGDLDCYRTSLAFLALSLTPLGVMSGADPAGVASLRADVATLRTQVPAAVEADFDTYATGVEAFATALEGVDLSDLDDPAARQQLVTAAAALETPEVTAAEDALQRYFAETCPAPAPSSTTTAG